MPAQGRNPTDRRIVFAARFLAKNCLHCPHVVEDTVGILKISPSRFRHLFKKETGFSPESYVKELRLRSARQMLERSSLSVKEVMAATSINDFSHFVRDFKALHGIKPSEVRKISLAERLANLQAQPDRPTDSHSGQDIVISVTEFAVKLPNEPS